MVSDGPMDGRGRVRALVAACGGYAAAMRATGIAHSTLAAYMRVGVITSAQHVVALCRAAGWSTGMVEPLVGLPADGTVEPRRVRGPRLRAAVRGGQ